MNTIKPFSESISVANPYDSFQGNLNESNLSEDEYYRLKEKVTKLMDQRNAEMKAFIKTAESVPVVALKAGKSTDTKLKIFIQKAKIQDEEAKWLSEQVKEKWDDDVHLRTGGYSGDKFNQDFKEFLITLHKAWKDTDSWNKLPYEKKRVSEIKTLIEATSEFDKEARKEIYELQKGRVPPWWNTAIPESYFKGAASIIENNDLTAKETENLIKRATSGTRDWTINELKASVTKKKVPSFTDIEIKLLKHKWGSDATSRITSGSWTEDQLTKLKDELGDRVFEKTIEKKFRPEDIEKIEDSWGRRITKKIIAEGWKPPKSLKQWEIFAIYQAFGDYGGDRIMSGKVNPPKDFDRGYSETNSKVNNVIPHGDFYHSSVGWY